jgi:hypothetical protein
MAKQTKGFRSKRNGPSEWWTGVRVPIINILIAACIGPLAIEIFKQCTKEHPIHPQLSPIPKPIVDSFFTGVNNIDYTCRSNGSCVCAKGYSEVYLDSFAVPEDQKSMGQFFTLRAQAYQQAILRICRQYIPVQINLNYVQAANQESFQQHPENVIASVLDGTFCSVFDSLRYDAGAKQYMAKFGICYKAGQLFPKELEDYVEQQILQIQNFQNFRQDPLSNELNIGLILQLLRSDSNFLNGYNQRVNQFKAQLNILQLDLEDKQGSYAIFFDSGKYQLSPISLVIIRIALKDYTQYIEDHPEQRYELRSLGYTDGRAVNPGGIAYYREGAYSPGGEAIDLIGGGIRIEHIPAGQTGNQRLAYARAFEASRQLEQLLNNQNPNLLNIIQLTYQGETAPASKTAAAHERRVSIKLIEKK